MRLDPQVIVAKCMEYFSKVVVNVKRAQNVFLEGVMHHVFHEDPKF